MLFIRIFLTFRLSFFHRSFYFPFFLLSFFFLSFSNKYFSSFFHKELSWYFHCSSFSFQLIFIRSLFPSFLSLVRAFVHFYYINHWLVFIIIFSLLFSFANRFPPFSLLASHFFYLFVTFSFLYFFFFLFVLFRLIFSLVGFLMPVKLRKTYRRKMGIRRLFDANLASGESLPAFNITIRNPYLCLGSNTGAKWICVSMSVTKHAFVLHRFINLLSLSTIISQTYFLNFPFLFSW